MMNLRDRRDEQRRWQDEKRREQQAKLTERRAREAKKIRNREYTIVSYFFVCIFISDVKPRLLLFGKDDSSEKYCTACIFAHFLCVGRCCIFAFACRNGILELAVCTYD